MSVLLEDKFSVNVGKRRKDFKVTLSQKSLLLQPVDILASRKIELAHENVITTKLLLTDPDSPQDCLFRVVYCLVPKIKCQVYEFYPHSDTREPEKLAALWVASLQKTFSLPIKVRSHQLLFVVDEGHGMHLYEKVQPMFDACGYNHELMEVTAKGQVLKRLKSEPKINRFGGIVVIANESLLAEVLSGIHSRDEWKCLLQTISIGLIPIGGVLGLSQSLSSLQRGSHHRADPTLAGIFNCLRGRTAPVDLFRLEGHNLKTLGVSNLGFGILPDIAKESQGCCKCWIQSWRILNLRRHSFRIAYLPYLTSENKFESIISKEHLELDNQLPDGIQGDLPPGWISEENDFIGVHVTNLPFLDDRRSLVPNAKMNDGILWLFLIRSLTSRADLRTFLNGLKRREVPPLDGIDAIKIRAFRIEPLCEARADQEYTFDGQDLAFSTVQGHVLPSGCRLMCDRY